MQKTQEELKKEMINIPPIPFFLVIFGFVARIIGIILIGAAMLKAASEFLPRVKWLKNVVDRVPILSIRTSTKKLLLIFTISLWIGSLVPLMQTVCYFVEACRPFVFTIIIPASMALAINNVLAGLILYVIYYTKEPEPVIDKKAVKDIQKTLKKIGQQTETAELRNEEIDANTEKGQGDIMRGRNGGKKNSGKSKS